MLLWRRSKTGSEKILDQTQIGPAERSALILQTVNLVDALRLVAYFRVTLPERIEFVRKGEILSIRAEHL